MQSRTGKAAGNSGGAPRDHPPPSTGLVSALQTQSFHNGSQQTSSYFLEISIASNLPRRNGRRAGELAQNAVSREPASTGADPPVRGADFSAKWVGLK
jgi:hypothetical protein